MEHITVSSEIWKAVEYLIISGVVIFAYRNGVRGIDEKKPNLTKNDLVKRLVKGIGIILVIASLLGFILLGTSSDCSDADPLYGGCATTQDFTPSNNAKIATTIYYTVLLGVPYLLGGYSRYLSIKTGKAQKEFELEQEMQRKDEARISHEIAESMKEINKNLEKTK